MVIGDSRMQVVASVWTSSGATEIIKAMPLAL
jgi:hypothetical protein